MTQHRQSTRTRTSTKHSVPEAGETTGTATTTGCPWCAPWPVVRVAQPCVPSAAGLHFFLVAFPLPVCFRT